MDDARTVEAAPAMLESVTRDAPVATVTVCDAAPHGLRDGDRVRFSGFAGMEELNAAPPPKGANVTAARAAAVLQTGAGVRAEARMVEERVQSYATTKHAAEEADMEPAPAVDTREVSVSGPYTFTLREAGRGTVPSNARAQRFRPDS